MPMVEKRISAVVFPDRDIFNDQVTRRNQDRQGGHQQKEDFEEQAEAVERIHAAEGGQRGTSQRDAAQQRDDHPHKAEGSDGQLLLPTQEQIQDQRGTGPDEQDELRKIGANVWNLQPPTPPSPPCLIHRPRGFAGRCTIDGNEAFAAGARVARWPAGRG